MIIQKLSPQYHKRVLLIDPKESEKLPDNKGCDHHVELKTAEENLSMGSMYRLTLEAERLLEEYMDQMIHEGKLRSSLSPIESPVLFVLKLVGKRLRLRVDYRHLNQHTVKDNTPLPIMQELQDCLRDVEWITKINLNAEFHLIRMLFGHEKYTAFRTKFGLFEYTVMPF
jgi:hypothetical protein